jgi:NitT/TauT family transport system permease protein
MSETHTEPRAGLAAPGARVDEERLQREEVARARQARRRSTTWTLAWRLVLLGALLVGWYLASGRIVDSLFASNPVDVAKAFGDEVSSGQLWYHLRYTLLEVAVGYTAGTVAALTLAGVLSIFTAAHRVLHPFLMAFYAIPKIAIAPLMIMWFGLGLTPKFLLSGIFVFFVVFMNTLAGLRSVSPSLINVARVMGASRSQLLLKVVYPSAIPNVLIAMRITVPEAMVGAIVGEFIAGNRGIGYLINSASNQYNTAAVFAGIIAILVVVLIMDTLVTLAERRLMRWRPPNPTER